VPAGYRIRLFADAAFSGASTDLTSSAASLFDRAFNDVASSVEVKAQETPDGGRPPQSGARKRVKQANGTLVSDAGTQLRGFGMSPDSGHNATNRGYAIKRDLTRSYGLNALHVFGECWSNTPGANMSVIDEIVALGRQHQYYVILAVGGCGDDEIRDEFGRRIHGNGAYDIKWLRKFWAIYAPRYKNETHVIYEIMNEPSFDNCSGQYQDHVFNMNAEMYKQIRGAAPDSHILMLTYPNLKNGRIVADAVDKLKSRGVDFANASIAAHGYDWGKDCNKPPAEALPDMLAGARSKDVALTVTEFDAETWKEFVGPLEKAGISYTHFKYVTGSDTSSFKSEFQNLNLSWCPDYGLWPQDSATCRR
jgi:hypothetical protein